MDENFKELISILGSDNVERIKETLTDELIDNLTESIRSEWVFVPDQWEDMFDEMGREVFEEVKRKYRKALKTVAEEKMQAFIEKMQSVSVSE